MKDTYFMRFGDWMYKRPLWESTIIGMLLWWNVGFVLAVVDMVFEK